MSKEQKKNSDTISFQIMSCLREKIDFQPKTSHKSKQKNFLLNNKRIVMIEILLKMTYSPK
jgi:hypothetical protein